MINKQTVNSIAPLVGTFSGLSVGLHPVAESILSAICTASNFQMANQFHDEVGFHEEWLESLRNSTVYGTNAPVPIHDTEGGVTKYLPAELHDKTMGEAADIVADSVVRGINYTKTVVKPALSNFLEHLDTALEVKGAVSNPFNIVPIVPSDAWDSQVIEMALAPLIVSQRPVIVTRNRIPSVVFDDTAINSMSSGNKRLDAALDKILADKGLGRQEIARSIFSGQGDVGSFTTYIREDGDLNLAKFILVNMLADNPPSIRMTLSQWQDLMLSLSQAYGALCGHHMRFIEDFRSSGNLILNVQLEKLNILVDSKMYDKWLETGGTPEILMGAMLKRRTANMPMNATIGDLDAQADSYSLTFSRFLTSEQHAERGRRTIRVRDALRKSLAATLAELNLDHMPEGTDINVIAKAGNEFIAKLHEYQLTDFGQLGTTIVCVYIFPFTNAKEIIDRMSSYLDEGMDAKEAERLTVTGIITDWTLDGIKVA